MRLPQIAAFNPDVVEATKREVRQIRVTRGYTQTDIARMFNVSQSVVSRWELGFAMPTEEQLERIRALPSMARIPSGRSAPRMLVARRIGFMRRLSTNGLAPIPTPDKYNIGPELAPGVIMHIRNQVRLAEKAGDRYQIADLKKVLRSLEATYPDACLPMVAEQVKPLDAWARDPSYDSMGSLDW